jgi:large subunit ribosomal protein L24
MKIKKGDIVLVISGKDRQRQGKVIKALPKEGKIVVEGINIKKKHIRPRREGQKGQIVELPAPLDVSNVKLLCPKCKKPTRIGYKIARGEKRRICKKCKEAI